MIKPTDEMVNLAVDKFLNAPNQNIGQIAAAMRAALADVLALVELTQAPTCGYPLSHPSHDFALPVEGQDGKLGPRQWCDGVPGDWQQPASEARGNVAHTEVEVWRLAHKVGAEYIAGLEKHGAPFGAAGAKGYREYVVQCLTEAGYSVPPDLGSTDSRRSFTNSTKDGAE